MCCNFFNMTDPSPDYHTVLVHWSFCYRGKLVFISFTLCFIEEKPLIISICLFFSKQDWNKVEMPLGPNVIIMYEGFWTMKSGSALKKISLLLIGLLGRLKWNQNSNSLKLLYGQFNLPPSTEELDMKSYLIAAPRIKVVKKKWTRHSAVYAKNMKIIELEHSPAVQSPWKDWKNLRLCKIRFNHLYEKMRKLRGTGQVRSSLLQDVALFKALGTFINTWSRRSWDAAAYL